MLAHFLRGEMRGTPIMEIKCMSGHPPSVSVPLNVPALRGSFDFASYHVAPTAAPATGFGRGTLRPRNGRGRCGTRHRLAILLGALVVATAPFVAAPPPATAAPIVYDITPASGATAIFEGFSGTVTLTGTFTFDPTVPTLVSVDLTLTGTGITPLPVSPDVFTITQSPFTPNSFLALSSATNNLMLVEFVNPLGNSPDPIELLTLQAPACTPSACITSSVVGSASPAATPEPPALALLSAALGLFLIIQRASRRERRPHPDQPQGS
jgi:hypothetical protein